MLPIEYDITVSAEAFSGTASLLAGFAITVLVLIVENVYDDDGASTQQVQETGQRALAMIAFVILANIAAAYLWGLVTGDTSGSLRPYIMNLVVVCLFGLAAVMTIEALLLIVPNTRFARIRPVLGVFGFFTAALTLLTIYASVLELLRVQQGQASYPATFQQNAGILIVMGLGMVLLPLVGGLLNLRGFDRRIGLEGWPVSNAFIICAGVWILALSGVFTLYRYSPPEAPCRPASS